MHVTCRGMKIMTKDFPLAKLEGQWNAIFKVWGGAICQSRILHPAKILSKPKSK